MNRNPFDKEPEFQNVDDLSAEEQELYAKVLECKERSEKLGRTDQVLLAKAYLSAVTLVIEQGGESNEKATFSKVH